jgi:O-antigen ligase/polysaccharide polymerase Wzy-like membrane protein
MKALKIIQRISLLLYFFSINFEVWDIFDGAFSLAKVAGYIYIATILPQLRLFLVVGELKSILRVIWIFFGLLTLISILNINYWSNAFFLFPTFQNIVLFWILMNHEKRDPQVLEKGLLAFAFGSVVLTMMYIAGIGVTIIQGRVSVFGANANTIGLFLCISIIILILASLQNNLKLGFFRILLLLPIPLMLKFMADTGSRVAFFSFVAAFVTGIFIYKTKNLQSKIVVFIVGIGVFILAGSYMMKSDILMRRVMDSVQKGDIASRDIIWVHLFQLISDNPVFGVGLTGYSKYSQNVIGELGSAHNVFIEVLCYTGIVGLLIFLIFMSKILFSAYFKYRKYGIILPAILMIPLLTNMLTHQILNAKIAWAIFAFAYIHYHPSSKYVEEN